MLLRRMIKKDLLRPQIKNTLYSWWVYDAVARTKTSITYKKFLWFEMVATSLEVVVVESRSYWAHHICFWGLIFGSRFPLADGQSMHTTTKTNWLTATSKLQFLLDYLHHLRGGKKFTCMLVVRHRIFNNLTLYGYESMHTCTKFNTTSLAHGMYLVA